MNINMGNRVNQKKIEVQYYILLYDLSFVFIVPCVVKPPAESIDLMNLINMVDLFS